MKRGRVKKVELAGLVVVSLLIVFILLNSYILFLFSSNSRFTGADITTTGLISFEILVPLEINITAPIEGGNYTFVSPGAYPLDLNLTTNEENLSKLTFDYSLWDYRHNEWVYENVVAFVPNTTFNAVRWWNQIFVKASRGSEVVQDNVTFFVHVPNTAPLIYGVNSTIYACEETQLLYDFYAIDLDEDELSASITSNNLFFVFPSGQYRTNTSFQIISLFLDKSAIGGANLGF